MPAKKKVKKGKKKGGKKKVPESDFEYAPLSLNDLGIKAERFVKCRICSTDLSHLNFEWPIVPTSVTISAVKNAINQRHGGTVMDVVLFKDYVHPDHMLVDVNDAATLEDIGVEGSYTAENLPTVTLFYDYPTIETECPVLCAAPTNHTSKYGIDVKALPPMPLDH